MDKVLEIVRKLNIYTDQLIDVRRRLINHKELVNMNWDSYEVNAVNDAIDAINRELSSVRTELENIAQDLIRGQSELEDAGDT